MISMLFDLKRYTFYLINLTNKDTTMKILTDNESGVTFTTFP